MILLDTHALVWLMEDSPRLGKKARARIEDERSAICVSVVSLWEIGILLEKERLSLPCPLRKWFERVVEGGITCVPLHAEHVLEASALPGAIHGDPGDRFLIATSRVTGWPLMTADQAILNYAAQRHVEILDARR